MALRTLSLCELLLLCVVGWPPFSGLVCRFQPLQATKLLLLDSLLRCASADSVGACRTFLGVIDMDVVERLGPQSGQGCL